MLNFLHYMRMVADHKIRARVNKRMGERALSIARRLSVFLSPVKRNDYNVRVAICRRNLIFYF